MNYNNTKTTHNMTVCFRQLLAQQLQEPVDGSGYGFARSLRFAPFPLLIAVQAVPIQPERQAQLR
jgi:hypothetical protein